MFLLKFQKLRILFDSIDPEGFGEIPVNDFVVALKTPELQDKVPFNKREVLFERAMKAKKGPGTISFQDFVEVVSESSILPFTKYYFDLIFVNEWFQINK